MQDPGFMSVALTKLCWQIWKVESKDYEGKALSVIDTGDPSLRP
jgi:hypothetical protein